MRQLTSPDALPDTVQRPGFAGDAHGAGIVFIGLSAFHKAHQVGYTDDALAAKGCDWRIIGASQRSPEPAQELAPQNALFTAIKRYVSGTQARVVGSMAAALCLGTDRQAVLEALLAPSTRIVSITVTEKGYGFDRARSGIDPDHPAIKDDLADPGIAQGLTGLLVWAKIV